MPTLAEHYRDSFSRERDFNLIERLTAPIRWKRDEHWPWFHNPLLGLKFFWQRGTRGWADMDVNNLDTYLARVFIGSLKHLKHHKHGVPSELVYKYAKLDGTNEDIGLWSIVKEHEYTGRAIAEYDATLDKIR